MTALAKLLPDTPLVQNALDRLVPIKRLLDVGVISEAKFCEPLKSVIADTATSEKINSVDTAVPLEPRK